MEKRARGPVIFDLNKATVREIWDALLAVKDNVGATKWSDDQRAVLLEQLYDELARRLGRPQRTWKDSHK